MRERERAREREGESLERLALHVPVLVIDEALQEDCLQRFVAESRQVGEELAHCGGVLFALEQLEEVFLHRLGLDLGEYAERPETRAVLGLVERALERLDRLHLRRLTLAQERPAGSGDTRVADVIQLRAA